jgi:hypothetical protein
MEFRCVIFVIILGIIISQNILGQESIESDNDSIAEELDNTSEELDNIAEEIDWTIHFWYGPSCSFGFFDYISFQYGLGSFFHVLGVSKIKPYKEKSFGINNYILYEYKNGYSKIRFTTNFSIFFPIPFLGCSLLVNISDDDIVWGFAPEFGLRVPLGFLDIFYRYNIYQNNKLNCNEFGIRLSLYFFIITNDK